MLHVQRIPVLSWYSVCVLPASLLIVVLQVYIFQLDFQFRSQNHLSSLGLRTLKTDLRITHCNMQTWNSNTRAWWELLQRLYMFHSDQHNRAVPLETDVHHTPGRSGFIFIQISHSRRDVSGAGSDYLTSAFVKLFNISIVSPVQQWRANRDFSLSLILFPE